MIRFKKDDGSNYPDWEEKSFGDIFTMYQTNTFSREQLNDTSGDVQNVHYGDVLVKYGNIIDCNKDNLPYINEDISIDKFKNESYVHNGDIIVADTAEDYTAGKVSEVQNVGDRKILSGLHTMLCRPQIAFASKFLGYYLNSEDYHKQIVRLLVGTKVYSINKKAIVDTLLKYPCIEEQQKIADLLSAVDDVISTSEQEVANLEEQKKGVIQKIFSREVRFKADDGSDYPEWEKRKLSEIGQFKANGVDKIIREGEKIVNMVNYMDVYNHMYIHKGNVNELMQVSAKDLQIQENNLEEGDILFTPSSETPDDIGHSIAIFEDLKNTVYSYHLMRFRPIKKIFNTKFLHYMCNIPQVLNQFRVLSQGTTRFVLSASSFGETVVEYPKAVEEQQKIADFLSNFDTAIEKTKAELECWKQIKKGLLQQLFM